MRRRWTALIAIVAGGGCQSCFGLSGVSLGEDLPLTVDLASPPPPDLSSTTGGDMAGWGPCGPPCAAGQFCATANPAPPPPSDGGPPDGFFMPNFGCNPLPAECVADETCACLQPYLMYCQCIGVNGGRLWATCGGG
jgi:hypothetical protein